MKRAVFGIPTAASALFFLGTWVVGGSAALLYLLLWLSLIPFVMAILLIWGVHEMAAIAAAVGTIMVWVCLFCIYERNPIQSLVLAWVFGAAALWGAVKASR